MSAGWLCVVVVVFMMVVTEKSYVGVIVFMMVAAGKSSVGVVIFRNVSELTASELQ